MTIFKKNTTALFRVFFLLFIIGLVGLLWQHNNNQSNQIKAEGGTITEGIIGTPRFINPVLAQTQTDLDLTRLIFTPIVSIDREGNTFYHLAEDIEHSKDGLQYTLSLRRDVYFKDDVRMTADDVIFTIESIQDPLIKSPLAAKWQGIVVEKIDQYTVLFKLARPFNDFLYNLEVGVLPKHIWGNIKSQEFIFSKYNTNAIGVGPYYIDTIEESDNGIPSKYILQNSRDTIESAYIKNINIIFFDNEELLIKALNNNKIDAGYGISPIHIDDLNTDLSVHSGTLPRVFAIFFNQEKQPLLKSQKIREAINSGINKTRLTNIIFSDYAIPINSPFGFESTDIYSQEKAELLIKEDGWSKNSEGFYTKSIEGEETILEFSLSIPNLEDVQNIANIIKDDLKTIGINVIIRSYDQGNLNQNVMRPREYESLLFGYEIEKPSDMYAFWHSSQISDPGLNMSLFKNNDVDAALLKMRSSDNPDLEDLDTLITKTTPAIFLYSPSYIYVLPKDIKNTDFSIAHSSDRFNTIGDWYKRTRHVWSFFINEQE